VEVPIYNFVTHSREAKTTSMYGANVLIFEGILAFHDKQVLDLLDVKIFVETDSDVRLARRLRRDIGQRGRDIKGVLEQYGRHVKPAFDYYIAPSMAHADIIVPRGGENEVAINLIVHHVQTQMAARGFKYVVVYLLTRLNGICAGYASSWLVTFRMPTSHSRTPCTCCPLRRKSAACIRSFETRTHTGTSSSSTPGA